MLGFIRVPRALMLVAVAAACLSGSLIIRIIFDKKKLKEFLFKFIEKYL